MKKSCEKKGKYSLGGIILALISVLSGIYFIGLVLYIGFSSLFVFFWALVSVFSAGGAIAVRMERVKKLRFPKWIKAVFCTAVLLAAVVFAIVEGVIIFNAVKKPEREADYVLVLGAKVNGTTPSKSLMFRINGAYDYLVDNPSAKAIVCGGKGSDEGISEAEAMKRTLVSKGIDENRIIMEDKSTSTEENIRFAMKYIEDENSKVVVTTNSYHVFRAVSIARKAGLKNVSGNPAGCVTGLIPQDFAREFFAVIKDFVFGNM